MTLTLDITTELEHQIGSCLPGLEEGIRVTVLVPEPSGEQGFELGPKDEAALLASIREADAGELTDGDEVLRELEAARPPAVSDCPGQSLL